MMHLRPGSNSGLKFSYNYLFSVTVLVLLDLVSMTHSSIIHLFWHACTGE